MNGQQLTNSSNSANGTPSSSYAPSLSSQSSRDASPASRPGALRKPYPDAYNHNHWPPNSEVKPTMPVPEPARTFPSSQPPSQPLYRFPTSTAPVTNHSPVQFPAPPHPPVSNPQPFQPPTQSPVQGLPNQLKPQPPFQTASSNQFSQQSKQFPPQSNQILPQPNQIPPQQPNQIPPQKPNQIPPQQPNQIPPQQPNQIPPKQPSQILEQQTNQIPQHQPNQFPPQFNQVPRQPNKFPPQLNQVPQQPNQMPLRDQSPHPSNQFQPPPPVTHQPQSNQLPKLPTEQNQLFSQPSHNQVSSVPGTHIQNNFYQQPSHLPPLSSQPLMSQNQVGPPTNHMFPQQNQPSMLSQNQMPPSAHMLNASSQLPNHFSQPPGQMPGPNQLRYPLPNQQPPTNQFNRRYPQGSQPGMMDGLSSQMSGMTVQQGFNKMWGMDTLDLLKTRDLLPRERLKPPPIRLQQELYESANCSPEIFRCTITKIPETKSLLDKSRLPLGVLIHPFKDLNQLSVIQCTVIVRCRMCRAYINPFVYFVDNKRWKCNLCFRVNELPEEFQFDPMSKTYGDPSRRPEIKSATIEFIAPSEYMVRPPQPAVYVFLLDVSRLACESGYLSVVCKTLLAELDSVPGDARTSVAFITYDSAVHFYGLAEGQGQPHQMVVVDVEDMFLPTPDNLLVNLSDCRELIRDLLLELPNRFQESYDTYSALGAALQAAYKLLSPTGGRVTVFQACLPNKGPGALAPREDPSQRAGDNPPHLNPATDFYKKLALDCSGQQIAVDLFLVNSQYIDLATVSGISRFSGGCMHHLPLFRSDKPLLVESLERMFQRYLTRKIGFEAVLRLRCTRGLSIHTFHGNFFVRSTDLLSLPNANPDAGFGMQVAIDESLTDIQNVCFQVALLYTSSKGERRIRVHTLCLPVVTNLADIMHAADQQAIAALLAKMAVDRSVQSSLSDAREAFVNVVADILSAYKLTQSSSSIGCLLAPSCLALLPLYILALLKHMAFRVGLSTRLDDRVFAMCQMKSLPLSQLIQYIYPDLYVVNNIETQAEGEEPPRLQLSSERVDSLGVYLMDDGPSLILYVGHNLPPAICQALFQVPHFAAIPHDLCSLPELENPTSTALRNFITNLQNEKPFPATFQILRDDSPHRMRFLERLVEDKNEAGISYYEFLQRVKTLMN